MPIIEMDPDAHAEFSLPVDRELPVDRRPVFVTRYITSRDRMKMSHLRRQAIFESPTEEQAFATYCDALKICLIGWRNLVDVKGKEIPFDLAPETCGLPDVYMDSELWDIMTEAVAAVSLAYADRKKSVSQSQSDSGDSVGDAAPESASTD